MKLLTHWGRDKMAAISQTTLSIAFFGNENVRISIKFSLKFVPKGPINNIPALVQIMAWRRPGDKPLSEPVMVSQLTLICFIRPQWVNYYRKKRSLIPIDKINNLWNDNAIDPWVSRKTEIPLLTENHYCCYVPEECNENGCIWSQPIEWWYVVS